MGLKMNGDDAGRGSLVEHILEIIETNHESVLVKLDKYLLSLWLSVIIAFIRCLFGSFMVDAVVNVVLMGFLVAILESGICTFDVFDSVLDCCDLFLVLC